MHNHNLYKVQYFNLDVGYLVLKVTTQSTFFKVCIVLFVCFFYTMLYNKWIGQVY